MDAPKTGGIGPCVSLALPYNRGREEVPPIRFDEPTGGEHHPKVSGLGFLAAGGPSVMALRHAAEAADGTTSRMLGRRRGRRLLSIEARGARGDFREPACFGVRDHASLVDRLETENGSDQMRRMYPAHVSVAQLLDESGRLERGLGRSSAAKRTGFD